MIHRTHIKLLDDWMYFHYYTNKNKFFGDLVSIE